MAISFTCEGCGKHYTVADSLAGKKAQCKKCNAVMKVPVPHREPNLNEETRAGDATVTGNTMHSLHGESVSGRSASGRSMSGKSDSRAGDSRAGGSRSGKSMSGRSMTGSSVGGSRPDEPSPEIEAEPKDQYSYADAYRAKMEAKMAGRPTDDAGGGEDGPSLEALKHVGQSKEGALDYAGEAGSELSRTRPPPAKNYASNEAVSFLLVVAFLGVLAYAVCAGTVPAFTDSHNKPYAADVVAEAGKPWAVLAAPAAITAVLAFAVVAPLVLAGWVVACKIANFRTPDGLYLRSLGIAVVPLLLMTLAKALPLGIDDQTIMLVGLLGVPAAYGLLQFVHNQKPIVAGIATGAGTILAFVGIAVAANATSSLDDAVRKPYLAKLVAIEKRKADDEKTRLELTKHDTEHAKDLEETKKADEAVAAVRKPLDAFKASLANNKQQTREKLIAEAADLSKQIADGQAKFESRSDWKTMNDELAAAKTAIAQFPSANPPAEVAEAPPAGQDWSAKPGRREVSVSAFDLTPPQNATLDLDTSKGLVWRASTGNSTLKIEQIPLPTPSQQRPWIAPAFVLNDAAAQAVSVAADDPQQAQVEYGTLAGLPAAKVTVSNGGGDTLVYTVHQGPTWLKCTVCPFAKDDQAAVAMTQAIRTVHPRAAAAAAQDPFPAADLVGRYRGPKDADADRIVEMLKTKPNAEDAIKSAMGISPDDAAYEKYGPLLVACATEKSSRPLWKLAANNTPLADQARAALRTLEPKAADDVAFAVLDIKDGNPATQVQRGIATLANADVVPDRVVTVGHALTTAIGNRAFLSSNAGPNLEAALEKWTSDEMAKQMDVTLKTKGADKQDLELAMKVLASTHNPKYATAMLNHVEESPDLVADAIINMGTQAEGYVITKLKDMSPGTNVTLVRTACMKMLAEIGTPRSIPPINAVAGMSGSDDVKAAAKDAIAKINDRKSAGKPS